MKYLSTLFISFLVCFTASAQNNYWQQKVQYKMDIDFNVNTNQYKGYQSLQYTNNSPDTLKRLYYHLYFNAFQPNSSMDARSRRQGTIKSPDRTRPELRDSARPDWDPRVKDRIQNLQPNEIGYQKIISLKMNGTAQSFIVDETILVVNLNKPILPKQTVKLDMHFEAQVPLQIRRSGRDNPNTKVRYSMSQWYPKLCEYDTDGWHPNPYIGREFYGVWGDFDVNITIDKNYILGGTGYLQNGNEIGFGYEAKGKIVPEVKVLTKTWKFKAPNVHDFMWAADPDYKHITKDIGKGKVIHVLYDKSQKEEDWQKVADAAAAVFPFIEKKFGEYPYLQYSFIQGGDGGMEYPMGTLLSGPGLGTVFHEWIHSWYQMMLGTNESLYAWMDEGFTEFATNYVENYYKELTSVEKISTAKTNGYPTNQYHVPNYTGYFNLVKSGVEEPLSTHADHFNTNYAYSNASYNKGCVFMEQLGYIIGEEARNQLLLNYYKDWRFKHPKDVNLIRMAEKQTGIELDWYREYFVNSTKTIDYKIDSLWEENGKTKIRLARIGMMPMPIDCLIETEEGQQLQYIPLDLMFNNKQNDYSVTRTVHPAWKWTHTTYTFETSISLRKIKSIVIDPSNRMADVERKNNSLTLNW